MTEADRHLMSLDPAAPRDSLRDRVPFSDKALAQRTRKFLSHSPEFTVKRAYRWWDETNAAPVYPAWTNIVAKPRPGGWLPEPGAKARMLSVRGVPCS